MNDKLPVASVVTLFNKKEKYIILGKNILNDCIVYDYMGGVYPFGFNKKEDFIYFNDDDIEFLCFLGDINYRVGEK